MKVELSEVIDAVGEAGDDMTFYYNKDTQKIVYILELEDDEELNEDLEEHWERYIPLPSKYEVNDYHLMELFIWDLSDQQQQDRLENAIRGRGAFRYFRDLVEQFGLLQKWYDFQNDAHEQIAREWCQDNNIEIIEKA